MENTFTYCMITWKVDPRPNHTSNNTYLQEGKAPSNHMKYESDNQNKMGGSDFHWHVC